MGYHRSSRRCRIFTTVQGAVVVAGLGVARWLAFISRSRLFAWSTPAPPPTVPWSRARAEDWVFSRLPPGVQVVSGPATAFDARRQQLRVHDDPNQPAWLYTLDLFHEGAHATQPQWLLRACSQSNIPAALVVAGALLVCREPWSAIIALFVSAVMIGWLTGVEWHANHVGLQRVAAWRGCDEPERHWLRRWTARRRWLLLWDALWSGWWPYAWAAVVLAWWVHPLVAKLSG